MRSISVPWLLRQYWDELLTLLICVGFDLIEYLFPPLMMPISGDLIDIVGITLSVLFFRWFGVITFLELIPGFDTLPIFTFAWLLWYYSKRKKETRIHEAELEDWK